LRYVTASASSGHGDTDSQRLRIQSEEPEEVMARKFIKTTRKLSHREVKGNVQLQSGEDTNQNRKEHLLSKQATFFF